MSVAELVSVCEQILGRSLEVDTDEQRRRVSDRAELVADARLLRAITGWEPRWTLDETLSDLLTGPDEA